MFTMIHRHLRTTKRLIFALFVCLLASTLVLMGFMQYLALPGKIKTPTMIIQHSICNSSLSSKHTDARKDNSIFNTKRETEPVANMNLIPVMDFQDLGINKRKVTLLIIVSTAPKRFDRRQAIRGTWWKHCIPDKVKCVFITDAFIVDHVQRNFTIYERNVYKDMELQPLQGGREFGLRFLNHVKWAMAKFLFRYLLRIDDDYFLCLRRLLSELPLRPKRELVWGYFHCEQGNTWIDESFMIFSRDIIHKFLSQNESTMLCHPHADQQIGLWLENITAKRYFHDKRLYHDPPASFSPRFKNVTNVCNWYLGLHGTYAKTMWSFGQKANDKAKNVKPIPDFSRHCKTIAFDYRKFHVPYRFDPKPCAENPSWNIERKMFLGREKSKSGY